MKDVSSRRGGRSRTKDAVTGKVSDGKQVTATDWTRLRRLEAAEIRKGIQAGPDEHATDEEFWKDARVVLPVRKAVVTIRLDSDLLEWFRRERGYQTRINAILRTYMNAHASEGRR